MVDPDDEDRIHWLTVAYDIIKAWEDEVDAPMLSTRDAEHLAERIADGLQRASERARRETPG